MKMTKNDLHNALKHYFGFETFKGHQEEIITSMINKENTSVIRFFALRTRNLSFMLTLEVT